MKTIEAVRRSAVGVGSACTIREVAKVMDSAGVGAVVVIDDDRPVGIVTDRDLVRRGLARGLSSDARVDNVMSTPLVTIDADFDLHDAYAVFRAHSVRRLAVVRDGRFVGMLTVDDLLVDLAADLNDLSRPVTAEEAVLLATALPRRTYAFTRDAGRPLPALDGARALDPVVGAGAARPAGPARPPGPMPPPSAADRVTLDPPATSASPPLWASEPTSTEPAPSPPPFEQLVAELAVMNHRLRELAAAVELLARSPLLQGERAAGDPDRLHP